VSRLLLIITESVYKYDEFYKKKTEFIVSLLMVTCYGAFMKSAEQYRDVI